MAESEVYVDVVAKLEGDRAGRTCQAKPTISESRRKNVWSADEADGTQMHNAISQVTEVGARVKGRIFGTGTERTRVTGLACGKRGSQMNAGGAKAAGFCTGRGDSTRAGGGIARFARVSETRHMAGEKRQGQKRHNFAHHVISCHFVPLEMSMNPARKPRRALRIRPANTSQSGLVPTPIGNLSAAYRRYAGRVEQ